LLYEAKRKVFWTGVRIPPGPPKGFLSEATRANNLLWKRM